MTARFRLVAVASWAVLGVVLLLGESVVRLARFALVHAGGGLTTTQWLALVAATLVMAYVEGYRTFSRSFGPRVVERAFELGRAPGGLQVILAPLYAMSLLGDTRPRVIRAWTIMALIVVFVVFVRRLPPTWRSIVDASVALSLAWGIVVICVLWARRVRQELGR